MCKHMIRICGPNNLTGISFISNRALASGGQFASMAICLLSGRRWPQHVAIHEPQRLLSIPEELSFIDAGRMLKVRSNNQDTIGPSRLAQQ